MIQVVLPAHLRTLAGISGDVSLKVDGEPTLRSIRLFGEKVLPGIRDL